MENDDLIIRLSGSTERVKTAFSEIEEIAKALGMNTNGLEIKLVPLKVERNKVKSTQSTDIMAQVAGTEVKVEAFLAEVSEMAINEFQLNPPSTNLRIIEDSENE